MPTSNDQDPAVLDGVPYFADVGPEERRRILALSSPREVAAGELLLDQGDTALECFLVLSGSVSVYVRGEYVASVGPGSMVGEMGLVDHRPRTASVVAVPHQGVPHPARRDAPGLGAHPRRTPGAARPQRPGRVSDRAE